MKRIETILAAVLLAAMVLAGGCEANSPAPGPVVVEPPPEPKPAAPVEAVKTPAISRPVIVIETSMGSIKAELWADSAPITVKNFLAYVDARHFDGLIFHRVMRGFMIQGGGFNAAMREKPTLAPIKNEASPDKKHVRGTLAMARTRVIDSATSQFFINLVGNDFLNHRDRTLNGFGYCAFGKVTEGMDVVDKIGAVPVVNAGGHQNVPVTPVVIKSIRRGK